MEAKNGSYITLYLRDYIFKYRISSMREVPLSVTDAAVSPSSVKRLSKVKVLTFASIGNSLELYDFSLYGIMLPFLAPLFFPAESPLMSLFIAWLSFAITFCIAPVGSIFWGWYGDKFGRVPMLRLSLITMAVPSLGIALLPTYDTIGLFAPAILIILRIMQGVSASGEIMGAKIFAMEALGARNHGLCSGIISCAGAFGVLLAMSMAYATSTHETIENFWRIPFFIGSCLFVVARLWRTYLAKAFTSQQRSTFEQPVHQELFAIITNQPYSSIIVFMLGALLGILTYSMHAFLNPFLVQQGVEATEVYQFSIYGLISTMAFAILTGIYLDNGKNLKHTNRVIITLIALLAFPLFILIQYGGLFTLLSYLILAGLLGMYACSAAVIMYRSFAPTIRCRGVMFNYAMGCAIFGGLTPLLLNIAVGFNPLLPGLIVSLAALSINIFLKWGLKHATLF